MALKHQTSTATFIQLAVVALLVTIAGVHDVAKHCSNASDCVTDSFLWLVILFGTLMWYMILAALGYFAEERRNYKTARWLLLGELFTAFVALMFLRTPTGVYGAVGSLIALAFALVISFMSFKIYRARGSRIVTATGSRRSRRRLNHD